ncbi:MAG: NYN domain-containing protein, partial [Gammaproteobacteria bacterium]|nr:NYN domain-containing protein [Gammaproteobacteria bacterium]NNC96807.1 NYN domain-containing protein [Gammaproteobacteria bacterium]NNM13364.1 NYN domain-containing protein [Gammaproteobacteria bacterium]
MTKRIAIFVDVQNIYYTTRDTFGKAFNYRKFWKRVSTQGEIVTAIAYATDKGDDSQIKFQDALRHIGFTVKLKPYITRKDGSAKADWDVGITIDVLDMTRDVDTVILLSGDGDFDLLLEKIKRDYGVTTEVYGVPALTANTVKETADHFRRIDADLLL